MALTRLAVLGVLLGSCAAAPAAADTASALPERNPLRAAAPALPTPKSALADAAKPEDVSAPPLPAAAPGPGDPPPLPTRKATVDKSSAVIPPLPVPKSAVAKKLTSPAITRLPALLNEALSERDAAAVKESIRASYSERFGAARAHMARIEDKAARKLAQWYYYRRSARGAEAGEIEAFRLANPDWPYQDRLRRNAEEALFRNKPDAKTVKGFFSDTHPESGLGKAALAQAHLDDGEKDKAVTLVREAWHKHDFGQDMESKFLERFSGLLAEEDHKTRADRFLYADRKSMIPEALRAAEHLDETEKKKIKARAAVVRRSGSARKLLKDIPEESAKDDVGFYFSRIQWLRRNDKDKEAWKLLVDAPSDPSVLVDPEEWWIERRINCRSALDANEPETAYRIASNHGPLSGDSYEDAEFLSGWIALRYLKRTDTAKEHFLALRAAATDAKTIARAEYWLGRTAAAGGAHEEAARHYSDAGDHPFTYYGQLARQAIAPGPAALEIPPAPTPTMADFKRFRDRDAVKAIIALRATGLENLAPLFFHRMGRTLESPGELVLLSRLALLMDQPHASVRLAKIALNRGQPMAEYAYPVGMLPLYKVVGGAVELPFLYALSRQESEFNPEAHSPAGARGLMQLMPGTARAVARQHNVRYRRSNLTEASYNMLLGVAHLGDLLERYDGSYMLTLVAYNAGPGRVTRWTRTFGDPRHEDVDPIDWVERIPFTETRKYVQKILMSLQIFRSRLNGPDSALRIVGDLHRGRASAQAVAVPVKASN